MTGLLSLLDNSQLSAYAEWFTPPPDPDSPVSLAQAFVQNLQLVKDEQDARLQVLMVSKVMQMSPSPFVAAMGDRLQREPDGILSDLLTKVHAKLVNPLDFAVWLHSPAGKNIVLQAVPDLQEVKPPVVEPRRIIV